MPTFELFDFKKDWHLCQPHLKNKALLSVLDRAMKAYLVNDYEDCKESMASIGREPPPMDKWSRKEGPWSYSRGDYWCMLAEEAMHEAMDNNQVELPDVSHLDWEEVDEGEHPDAKVYWEAYHKIEGDFYPKPGTYQWYQLKHGCHWIANWCRKLGELIFPDREWVVCVSDVHSAAVGLAGDNDWLIMDILNFEDMTAGEIVKFIGEPSYFRR